MKRIMLLFLPMSAAISFLAYRTADDTATGILKRLGINNEDAKEYISSNMIKALFFLFLIRLKSKPTQVPGFQ
jgi:hypothetical protein